MGHISLSPAVASQNFSPLEKTFDRATKEGDIPQVIFFVGSQYNIKLGGETSTTTTGNITNDSITITGGKAEIALESSDGTEVENILSFIPFMYFYPGVKLVGHSEIQDDDVGPPTLPTQRLRYEFEDLATADKITVDLEGGDGNAVFRVTETNDGTEYTLVEKNVTAGITEVKWEIDYIDSGLTTIYYKEPNTDRVKVYAGELKSVLGESKVSVRAMSTQQTLKTLKTDFILVYYPNLAIGATSSFDNRLSGRMRVYDTNNEVSEADWTQVYSSDHPFVGERVIENGLIRVWIKTTPKMEVYGWNINSQDWELTGSVMPKATNGDISSSLKDVVFDIYNDIQMRFLIKYGIVNHLVSIRRGQPVARFTTDSKEFRINTAKRRFSLSVDDTSTDIPDFNQKNSDDASRGNPLNLSTPNNPFTFTDDATASTGLQLLDDNWFAYYNENSSSDMVGFVGVTKRPTGLIVDAVSATELNNIDLTFDVNAVLCVGILEGDPTTTVSGIPSVFNIGDMDTYVKWRANEGIYGFNQRGYVKRKR